MQHGLDRMAELISWETATDVATRVARRREPMTPYEQRLMEAEFEELTVEAEELVATETGLRSLAGPARARVADRPQWVDANVASFQRLLRPVTDKLERPAGPQRGLEPDPAPRCPARSPGPRSAWCSGWMSTRVLGQYDQLLIEDEHPEQQDIVYYVGTQRGLGRTPLRFPAPRVPAVAGPARGDPPGPVHRRAVDAGPFPVPGGADPGRGRPGPQGARGGAAPGSWTRSGPGATRWTRGVC